MTIYPLPIPSPPPKLELLTSINKLSTPFTSINLLSTSVAISRDS